MLKTSELQRNDVVRCAEGDYKGRLFRVSSASGTDFIAVDPLTKGGVRDRRYLGWSGAFIGCTWELLKREVDPPAPGPSP